MPTTSARLSFRIGRTASVVIVVFSSERVERRLGLLRREGYVAGLARCLRFGDEIRRAAALDPGADERARGLDVLAAWRLNVLTARGLNVLAARGLKVLPGADECARGLNVFAARSLNVLPARSLNILAARRRDLVARTGETARKLIRETRPGCGERALCRCQLGWAVLRRYICRPRDERDRRTEHPERCSDSASVHTRPLVCRLSVRATIAS